LLAGSGLTEYVAKRYAGRIRHGGILLSVHCDNQDWCNRAKTALKNTGARNISSASETSADYGRRTSRRRGHQRWLRIAARRLPKRRQNTSLTKPRNRKFIHHDQFLRIGHGRLDSSSTRSRTARCKRKPVVVLAGTCHRRSIHRRRCRPTVASALFFAQSSRMGRCTRPGRHGIGRGRGAEVKADWSSACTPNSDFKLGRRLHHAVHSSQ